MDKANFKKKLLEAIAETRDEIQSLDSDTQPISPDNAIGRLSRMDALNSKSVDESVLRNLRQKLKHLESALEQIDNENFGKCARCGTKIPEGRLLLVPQSRFCVNCAR